MTEVKLKAWTSFVAVIENFLGNHKSENYMEMVNEMHNSFESPGRNMRIKVHYLHSHLECFPENLGDFSEEQGERFHQDIKTLENCHQGRCDMHMMADYCWSLENVFKDGKEKKFFKCSLIYCYNNIIIVTAEHFCEYLYIKSGNIFNKNNFKHLIMLH